MMASPNTIHSGHKKLWSFSALTILSSVLLLQCCCIGPTVAMKSPDGYMIPSENIYIRRYQIQKYTCHLYHANETNNSSHLSMSDNNKTMPVKILNATSIEAYLNTTEMIAHQVICKVHSRGIGYVEAFVGTEPIPVENFGCISKNFEKLNCTFEFAVNPIVTNYTLHYSRLDDPFKKSMVLHPETNATTPKYWFVLDGYLAVIKTYEMNLTLENRFGVKYQIFEFDMDKLVLADPPYNLDINLETGNLSWSISDELLRDPDVNTMIYLESDYETRAPIYKTFPAVHWSVWLILNDLTAYTRYRLKMRIRMDSAYKDRDELWSDWAELEFQTLSRTPDKPPATNIGSFSVNENNDVVIFWKQLKVYEQNAPNASYLITKMVSGSKKREQLKANITATMYKMQNVKPWETMRFEIHSSNALGLSNEASDLIVPRKVDRVGYPRDLKKNRHGRDSFTLSWREPERGAEQVQSYTVFWCKSNTELANQCEGSIDFEVVDATTTEFTKTTTDGLNFAVSANTADSSSGMVWALCTASESDDIGKLKTIWTSSITSNSMEIQWSLDCVDRPILRHYNLSYCPITSPKDLTCKNNTEVNVTLPNTLTHYKITGLKPYTTYRTIIYLNSDTRWGAGSMPQINTTYEATPSQPRRLSTQQVTNTSVILKWYAPENMNGVLKNYEIGYNHHRKEIFDEFKDDFYEYRLDNLEPYTYYDIVVKACSNCCNCSEPSNTRRIRTLTGKPGIVLTTQFINEVRQQVTFKWTAPTLKGGELDFYEVKINNSLTNSSEVRRTKRLGCYLNVGSESGYVDTQMWEVQVRAVNIFWSSHAKLADEKANETSPVSSARFQRHSSLESGSGVSEQSLSLMDLDSEKELNMMTTTIPAAATPRPASSADDYKSCLEDDEDALELRGRDKHLQELPGPWSPKYEHLAGASAIVWSPVLASTVLGVVMVFLGVYLYKKFFRLKKGTVVLPPGLTDIAAKPGDGKGKGGGAGGVIGGGFVGNGNGLLGHGNGIVIGTEASNGISRATDQEAMFEGMNGGLPELTFDDRQLVGGVNGGVTAITVHSDANSLYEQEQSLLEGRLGMQSSGPASSSSSSSISTNEEHEEKAMLGSSGADEEEEEDEEESKHSRRGKPSSLQHDVLAAMMNSNKQQQQQQHHQMKQLHPMHQPVPPTGMKPAANGYVTIAQRSDGYTQLGDLMKPLEMHAPTEDKGITGYVTHKQLADFGQRMQ